MYLANLVNPVNPVKHMATATVGDLAIFGGPPAFENVLHVGQPNIGNREKFIGYINDILDRRWLTNGGTYVTDFEKRIADTINVTHCVAMGKNLHRGAID